MHNISIPDGTFWLNGKSIRYDQLIRLGSGSFGPQSDFEITTLRIIEKWLTEESSFELFSSGSTGKSKSVSATRDAMEASAALTLKTLDISVPANAVLCLHPKYTAGTMFLIRSLIGKMNLYAVTPSSNPLPSLPQNLQIDLISLVPNQLYEIFKSSMYHSFFHRDSILLIGGASLPSGLEHKTVNLPGKIYHTFGMAETISHIALRKINNPGKSNVFETLGEVEISKNENNCLVIYAPHLFPEKIETKDIIEIIDYRHFLWKGRLDNVVVSGGIKLPVEWLEDKIEKVLADHSIDCRFFLSSLPDPGLGEKLVMIVENSNKSLNARKLNSLISSALDKYEVPKEIYFLDDFIYAANDKINRMETMSRILKQN